MFSECLVKGCAASTKARGLCNKHWRRWYSGKIINTPSCYDKTAEHKFWECVNKLGPDDCWLWTGHARGRGKFQYGVLDRDGRRITAHRFSFELHNGPIPVTEDPRDNCVCHKCDEPLCVNPIHLYLGTHDDNMMDTKLRNRRRKTHCKRGHEFTESNKYVSKIGAWHCRACHRLREQKRRRA